MKCHPVPLRLLIHLYEEWVTFSLTTALSPLCKQLSLNLFCWHGGKRCNHHSLPHYFFKISMLCKTHLCYVFCIIIDIIDKSGWLFSISPTFAILHFIFSGRRKCTSSLVRLFSVGFSVKCCDSRQIMPKIFTSRYLSATSKHWNVCRMCIYLEGNRCIFATMDRKWTIASFPYL